MLTRYLLLLVMLLGFVGSQLAAAFPGTHIVQTSTHDTIDVKKGGNKTYKFTYSGNSTNPTVTGVKNPAGKVLDEVSGTPGRGEYSVETGPLPGDVTITLGDGARKGGNYEIETSREGGSTPVIKSESWSA